MEPSYMNKEIRAEKFKVQAFDEISKLSLLTGKQLMEQGHGSLGLAIRSVLLKTHQRIEDNDDNPKL